MGRIAQQSHVKGWVAQGGRGREGGRNDQGRVREGEGKGYLVRWCSVGNRGQKERAEALEAVSE